ncbi:transporter substrate-binding domain-containing protein [Leeia sp. TBRC 13508]|uniref:Transporter substrate-binding domain-containing protein n=1 Tax=Leeia speluncae TaxID=2884804 RepID=A0ABS8D8V5_9NEIS|nr:transporter substrate-binding domain-containing protein [Leeia speluncae]MCB6184557.1 transporter substrate-binding domain-containing protein [Leeia speluncae]
MRLKNTIALTSIALGTLFVFNAANAADVKSITLATEAAYEPWNLTKPDGTISGFEPELLQNLCARMKIQCKVIPQDWDGMITGLKAHKYDVIIDAILATEERKKEVAFSVPYATTPGVFAALKGGKLAALPNNGKTFKFTKANVDKNVIASLKAALKGKTIGIQAGTVYSPFIYENFKDVATIREYKAASEHDMDLSTGRIDVVFDDATYFKSAFEKPSNKNMTMSGPLIGGSIWGDGEAFGAMSERRIDRLVNPLVSGLPAFLAANNGCSSGFMIAQYTAVSLVNENRRLSAPASLDGGITSALQEDHLSHATPAAVKLLKVIENTKLILAIELLAATQAYDLQVGKEKKAAKTDAIYQLVREHIPFYADDRPLAEDFKTAIGLMSQHQPLTAIV